MQSKLEIFFLGKVQALKDSIQNRDRAVVIAALLSFTPIFPACMIGAVISIVNLYLVKMGSLKRSELRLSLFSLAAGMVYTILWVVMLSSLSATFGAFLSGLLDIITAPVDLFFSPPGSNGKLDEYSV